MKFLNVFRSKEKIISPVKGVYVRFAGLQINKKSDRRAFLQSLTRTLCLKGWDASVASVELSDNFDIAIIGVNSREASWALTKYSDLRPQIVETNDVKLEMLNSAWQNRVRSHLSKKGFIKIGDRYVLDKDVRDGSTIYKRSFRIQSKVLDGHPSLYIDPRTRIMIPLTREQIDRAEDAGEESDVRIRVLPNWQGGILVGRSASKPMKKKSPSVRNRSRHRCAGNLSMVSHS